MPNETERLYTKLNFNPMTEEPKSEAVLHAGECVECHSLLVLYGGSGCCDSLHFLMTPSSENILNLIPLEE